MAVEQSTIYRDSAGHLFDKETGSASASASSTPSITSAYSLARAVDGYNATSAYAGTASLLSVDAYNARTGGVSLALYDKASAPVVGSDTPRWTVYLPPLTPTGRDWPTGLRFINGIALALIPDDATGLMAGDVIGLNLGYAA